MSLISSVINKCVCPFGIKMILHSAQSARASASLMAMYLCPSSGTHLIATVHRVFCLIQHFTLVVDNPCLISASNIAISVSSAVVSMSEAKEAWHQIVLLHETRQIIHSSIVLPRSPMNHHCRVRLVSQSDQCSWVSILSFSCSCVLLSPKMQKKHLKTVVQHSWTSFKTKISLSTRAAIIIGLRYQ